MSDYNGQDMRGSDAGQLSAIAMTAMVSSAVHRCDGGYAQRRVSTQVSVLLSSPVLNLQGQTIGQGGKKARIIGVESDCAIRQQHIVQTKKASSFSLELLIIQEYGGLCGLNGSCAGSWSSTLFPTTIKISIAVL